MPVLRSQLDVDAAEFRANAAHHSQLAATLRERLAQVRAGGPPRAQERLRRRGKLPVRARIAALCDAQAPFLELAALAAWGRHAEPVPAAGLVAGVGRVCGRECVIVANDPTVKGGTYFPETIKKHLRAQEVALQSRLPCIYLVDSGGIYLPAQADTFADRGHFGRIFYNQANLSAAGIPQIAAVLGMCTAGGAYVPAMADENVIVRGTGTIYLAGPPLVRAATGEEASEQELGGGEMHCRVSGLTDHLAEDEADALRICRDIVTTLAPPHAPTLACVAPEEPCYPAAELYGVLPRDVRTPYDVHEVLARLLDGSRLLPFKPEYGPTLVCGFAHLMGYPVGVVASNGVLFGEAAAKGAHFVQLCDRRGIPLLFLQNVTGFMVGKKYEQAGIAKQGAKMVAAVATAQVPRLTVLIGASHGAGNYAMCGRGALPNMLFTWPNARIGVMGAEQAAATLAQVQGERVTPAGGDGPPLRARIDAESDPYYGTARLWDDGIIDPVDTRAVLALALGAALGAPPPPRRSPIYRM